MEQRPRLKKMHKTCNGKFLKSYRLEYEMPEGGKKYYEMVSRSELTNQQKLGSHNSGVSVVVFCEDKLLLLKEYRMAVGDYVINLVGGMLESGESIEECVKREVEEETGLVVTNIKKILPPSFAAVAICDIKTSLVIAQAQGKLKCWDEKENIYPGLYTREEAKELLRTEKFAARCQMITYYFSEGHTLV
ncbi:MAG: NUDIX hydrolase [Lachnospiraceae bacterium]|nr:NUDIX hydrolase [Lachnospiraceae bacterium]